MTIATIMRHEINHMSRLDASLLFATIRNIRYNQIKFNSIRYNTIRYNPIRSAFA